jgi:hypothetical protein
MAFQRPVESIICNSFVSLKKQVEQHQPDVSFVLLPAILLLAPVQSCATESDATVAI